MVLCAMDQHYSHTFTTFCEKKKDNREQSVLIDSSELQSLTDYSEMCHCQSENVTQLLLITEAVMVQSNTVFAFSFKTNLLWCLLLLEKKDPCRYSRKYAPFS